MTFTDATTSERLALVADRFSFPTSLTFDNAGACTWRNRACLSAAPLPGRAGEAAVIVDVRRRWLG